MKRQLISADEAVPAKCQHKTPCSDCPWHRGALPGWLGSMSTTEWLAVAHAESIVDCHVLEGAQCAGIAIYRANVLRPRAKEILQLPADRIKVFSNPAEFVAHHEDKEM